jgi:hypothetical protein
MKAAPIRFEIERHRADAAPPCGFDLGDLTLVVGDQTHTSRVAPRLAMMIYITLSSLLDGVAELLAGERRSYELIAADSSFSFTLTCAKPTIRVSVGRRVLGYAAPKDLAEALLAAARAFLADENRLPTEDPVQNDLAESIAHLESRAHIHP